MPNLWKKISKLGVREDMSISEQKKVELTNQFSVVAVLLMAAVVILIATFGLIPLFMPQNLIVFFSAFAIYLNWKGFTRFSGIFLSVQIPILIISLAVLNKLYIIGQIPYTAYLSPRFGLIGISIIPMILIDHRYKKTILATMIFQLLCIFMLDPIHRMFGLAFEPNDFMTQQEYDRLKMIVFVPYIFITSATFFLITINERYEEKIKLLISELKGKNNTLSEQKEEITQQNSSLQNAYDVIDTKNIKLTDSIRYARRIQKALFPKKELIAEQFQDYFILNQPKDIVSGDFYWTAQSGDKTYLAVADCTGHGVPGAMMSMLGISALNDIIFTSKTPQPAAILDELRARIKTELGQNDGNSDTKDGMDMALCAFDFANGTMEFAGANNPVYIVYQDFTILKPTRNPISFFVKEKPFENKVHPLQKGQWIYMFSDGYADQFGGKAGFKYTLKAFRESISTIAHLSGNEQKEQLIERLKQWQGDYEQIDDILVVGVKI